MKKRFTEAQIIGFLREAEAGLPVKDLCRVRHPARPRWRAFLMALAVLAGLHYFITVREGSPFLLIPVLLSFPFALRAIIRGWLGSAPAGPELSGPSPSGLASHAGP